MITFALSASIGARAEDVWCALTDPAVREEWDDRVLGEVSLSRPARRAEAREPTSSRSRETNEQIKNRWRFLLGGVPMVLQDVVLEIDPLKRQFSRVSIGSMHFDQTFTLFSEDDETGPHTRLGMKLVASNSIAVIGEVLPRLDVQKILMEYVDTTLQQVQKYCER